MAGRKPKYLTVEKFDEFVENDVRHIQQGIFHTGIELLRLKGRVNGTFWLALAILAAIIANWAVG